MYLFIANPSANIDLDKSFESKAQQRYMHAAAERGDIPKKTVEEFDEKTKDFSKLPEHVKKGDEMATYNQAADAGMEKAHIGFDKLQSKIEGQGHSAESAAKIAAAVGNKKYGEKKMHHAAEEGKPLKEGQKIDKSCEHSDNVTCDKCNGTHSTKDLLKGLTSRMLSMVSRHKEKLVAPPMDPEFEAGEARLLGPQVAQQAHVDRPFEPITAPKITINTPAQSPSPLTPDFMSSCDGCGYVHKSLDTCPRCAQVAASNREATPIWRR